MSLYEESLILCEPSFIWDFKTHYTSSQAKKQPLKEDERVTTNMLVFIRSENDDTFVPRNEVSFCLRGVKILEFRRLASQKRRVF